MFALNCPNCGAPLPDPGERHLAVCLYCNSVVRLEAGNEQPHGALERSLPPEDMESIKKMLLDGQRTEALRSYQRLTATETAEAEMVIDALAKDLSMNTMLNQQLTPYGVILAGLSLVVDIVIVIAWVVGKLSWGWAVFLLVLPVFQVIFLGPALLTTLRYAFASRAPAITLKMAHIGVFKTTRMDVHTYRVWIEVQPPGRPPFRTELVLPIKAESLYKLKPGARFQVKYFPGRPESVLFDKTLAASI